MERKVRILVVEDEASMQVLLLHTLRRAGFEVQLAKNGLQAQELLRSERFDLICSDVMMSGVDGIELCNWTKSQAQLRDVPFVLLSSRAQRGDRELGLDAGATVYMTKPFDVEDLVTRLHALAPGNNPAAHTNGSAHANGTAHANGSAHANGTQASLP